MAGSLAEKVVRPLCEGFRANLLMKLGVRKPEE
jgi:hypothetical protein